VNKYSNHHVGIQFRRTSNVKRGCVQGLFMLSLLIVNPYARDYSQDCLEQTDAMQS
jgi:hypothetical protein